MENNHRILIVDDEPFNVDYLEQELEDLGYQSLSASNGFEALQAVEDEKPDLVLLDIMMPGMDGFQLLDKLKNDHKKIPVVMITGYSTVENAVNSLYKGAVDFIAKPFTFEEITSAIYRAVEYGKLQLKIQEAKKNNKGGSVIYVPCPPRYKRLGNISWMNLETQGSAIIGATDLYLQTLNSLKKIGMMETEDVIVQGNSCGKLETDDELVHNLLAPVGGRIVEKNEMLLTDPTLLEKDPYFKGWMYRIIPSDIEYEMKYLISCSSDRV